MRRRVGALAVGMAAIVAAVAALAIHDYPRLPPPGGRFAVGTSLWREDSPASSSVPASDSQACRIGVRLWYPAEPATGGGRAPYDRRPTGLLSASRWVATDATVDARVSAALPRYPVLLFFPGWDGGLTAYTAIVQDLASRGFVVAGVDYDSAGCALPDGVAAPAPTEVDFSSRAAFERTVRVADTKIDRVAARARNVLDGLADLDRGDGEGRFSGRLDLSRTAAIGHSLGGAIAVQLAWLDPRIKAAIDLDGWLFGAAGGGWIQQPFLVMGSDGPASATDDPTAADPGRRYPSILAEETDGRIRAAFVKFGGVEVTIGASTHEDFSDAPYLSRTAALFNRRPDGHVVRTATDCAVTFFDSVFRAEISPTCRTSNPDVRIEVWRPTAVHAGD